MERKLVSIQIVESIRPIDGADRVVLARVQGWDVVVKKGEFSPGATCVYFEIDALLPSGATWAEFMRPRGFRVKTARLRGVLSQGLALPLDILPEALRSLPVGSEVTAALGVQKYEPVVPLGAEVAGPFPGHVPKTDEQRLQSALGVLDELRGHEFYVSTKCDGTSATFVKLDGQLVVCSRNWALAPGAGPQGALALRHGLAERLPEGLAVQGEVCGPGIQKNRLGFAEHELRVFSLFDVRRGVYLGFDELVSEVARLGLQLVPIDRVVRGAEAARFEHTLDGYLAMARGTYAGTSRRREGIVVRPLIERHSPTLGGRLSFKVINNEFLLEDED
jgi:RNA ligase (TIGR02306 family)